MVSPPLPAPIPTALLHLLLLLPIARPEQVAVCPCRSPATCQPLPPRPAEEQEVVAFSSWNIESSSGSADPPRLLPTYGPDTLQFDWDKMTAYAAFGAPGKYKPIWPEGEHNSSDDPSSRHNTTKWQQTYCTAHEHGVRVLDWGFYSYDGVTWCGMIPTFWAWASAGDDKMFNQTAVRKWAKDSASCVPAKGFDGVLLDMEGPGMAVGATNKTFRDAVTFAVCALKAELNKTLPGNVLYWTTDTGPYFDYHAMTVNGCVDMWLDMFYWCIDYELHATYRNRANSPMPFITMPGGIIDTYVHKFGVPVSHLGVIFPFFACSFSCKGSE